MTSNRLKLAAVLAVSSLAMAAGGCASWNHTRTASNGATAEHRGPAETVADATITAKIKTKFAADNVVKARDIDVDTARGVVTLKGTVNSANERDRAIALARDTHGVVDVRSELKPAS